MSLFRRLILVLGAGGAGAIPEPEPSAWDYFNLIGKIWLQRYGSYFKRESGTGVLYVEEPEGWGGGYWNRE